MEITLKSLAFQWIQSRINQDVRKLVVKAILFAGLALIAMPIISYSGTTSYTEGSIATNFKWDNNTDYWMVSIGVFLTLLSAFLSHVFFSSPKFSKAQDLSKLQKLLKKNKGGELNLEIQQRFKDIFKIKRNTSVDEIGFLSTRNGGLDAISDYRYANPFIEFLNNRYRPLPNHWNFEKVIKIVTNIYITLGIIAVGFMVAPLCFGVVGTLEAGFYTSIGLAIGFGDILLIPTLRKYSCAKRMIELS